MRRKLTFFHGRGQRLVAILAVVAAAQAVGPPAAARPSAMRLFPQETLLLVRMADARELGTRWQETSTARMVRDPQLAPLVERLYDGAGKMYTDQLQERLGISWEELQQLPQGEVAFGIVARAGRAPAFLLLVDQGEGSSSARPLLERALEAARERGGELSSETIAGVEVTVVRDGGNQDRMIGLFERENTLVAATDADVLRGVLRHWDGGAAEGGDNSGAGPGASLADNHKFSTILRHSRRPQDPPPHLIFFIDPVELLREFGRDNLGVQTALRTIPMIGLDGLLGIGGTLTFAVAPYDDLTHLHVLLENPRAGLLQIVQFEQGDTAPQPWVPRTVENYVTWRWNFPAMYDRIETMVDRLIGEGRFDLQVERRVSEPLGIDLPTEVIENLAGRVTWITGFDKPARWGSRQNVVAFELVDAAEAEEILGYALERFADWIEERRFGSVTYYAILPAPLRDQPEEEWPFHPFVAILEGHLFVGGSTQLFEQLVAARDGTAERLADSVDYQRVVETLGRETAGQSPALFWLQRSEESLRHVYDLLTSEQSREFLAERAEGNALFAALVEALDENALPPFDTLLHYMPPGGGILYDSETGYHGISFSLRNEAPR